MDLWVSSLPERSLTWSSLTEEKVSFLQTSSFVSKVRDSWGLVFAVKIEAKKVFSNSAFSVSFCVSFILTVLLYTCYLIEPLPSASLGSRFGNLPVAGSVTKSIKEGGKEGQCQSCFRTFQKIQLKYVCIISMAVLSQTIKNFCLKIVKEIFLKKRRSICTHFGLLTLANLLEV